MVAPVKYVYDAEVLDVHDGDTIKVAARLRKVSHAFKQGDLGFHVHSEGGFLTYHTNLRFLGLNAPELATPEGKAARTYLLTLIAIGDVISIRSSVDVSQIAADKYGDRWDAVLIRKSDGLVINDDMINSGHAKAWDGKGPKPTEQRTP